MHLPWRVLAHPCASLPLCTTVDANQELIALGVGCLGGSFFQSHTISGSFTRSAINTELGAKTSMSVAFTGLFIVSLTHHAE